MDEAMITSRLRELEANYQAGEQQLRQLEDKKQELQRTLQRIAGAIQVLKELLEEIGQKATPGDENA
jgi:predicted nuclease with TOPRIM domain